MIDIPICNIGDLCEAEPTAREILSGEKTISVIVFAKNGEYAVFLNSCPHTGVRLEWRPNDFMDHSSRYFQCAMHGALFQTDDGLCVEGPCKGATLIKLKSVVRNSTIYLVSDDVIPDTARIGKTTT